MDTVILTPAEKAAQLWQALDRATANALGARKDRERATVALDALRQKEIRATQELERLARELKVTQESII